MLFEAGFDLVAGGDGGGAFAFDGEGGGAGGEAGGFPDVAAFPEADEEGGGEDVAGACRVYDVGGEGVDVAPVAAHTDVGAVVAAREGDDLDEVRPVGERGRGFSRGDVLVRKEEGSSVPEHSVDVEIGGHDRADAVLAANTAQPALRADAEHRAAETGRHRFVDFADHGAEKDDRYVAPVGREVVRRKGGSALGNELEARPFTVEVAHLGGASAVDDLEIDAGQEFAKREIG